MPAKKKPSAKNGMYYFMQSLLPGLRKEGRVFPNGMADVVQIALPRWKGLPEEEKERFEKMAKDEKKKNKGAKGDSARYDNVGNIISQRRMPEEEKKHRRVKERKIARSRWPAKRAIMEEKFYFISIEYLCKTEEGEFLPCEIGMVEWSMKNGITKTFHKFIQHGGIPLGYRFTCQSHSDDTHQIPVDGFELADNNYMGIWIQMKNFVNPSGEKREYPPVYCMEKDMECVEYCMDWLYRHACLGGDSNLLHKIYFIEDMVLGVYEHCGAKIAESEVSVLLETSNFDYEPNTRCPWHEELGIKFCALGTCKRYAYALSDSMSCINGYEFDLTPAHVPTRTDKSAACFTVLPSSAIQLDPAPLNKGRRKPPPQDYDSSPFGGRDIRYKESSPQVTTQYPGGFSQFASPKRAPTVQQPAEEEENFGATMEADIIVRSGYAQPNNGPGQAPGYQAPSAPWARTAAPGSQDTSLSESDFPALGGDFPALGGGSSKFAGRPAPPAASELPKPTGWQDQPGTTAAAERLPRTMGKVAMQGAGRGTWAPPGFSQPQPGPPQANQSQASQPPTWQPQGQGLAPQSQGGAWTPAGRGRGSPPREDKQEPQIQPADSRPTLQQAVQNKQGASASQRQPPQQNPWTTPVAGIGRGGSAWGQGPPSGVNPAAGPGGAPAPSALGRGRGRGVWAPQGRPATGPAPAAMYPVGRGRNPDLASLSIQDNN